MTGSHGSSNLAQKVSFQRHITSKSSFGSKVSFGIANSRARRRLVIRSLTIGYFYLVPIAFAQE